MKFLVVDKSYPNNLLGRDLIEKLNLFPGVKNVNLNKFEDVVNNYKIDNSRPIKNFEAELYPKPDHFPSFQKARSVPFSYKPKVEEAIGKLVESDYLEKVEFLKFCTTSCASF